MRIFAADYQHSKDELVKVWKGALDQYNTHPALRKGKLTAWPDKDVLIFEKSDNDERFLILVNVRNEPKPATIPSEWAAQDATDVLTGKKQKLPSTLQLVPFQYCILSIQ